MGVLGPQGAHGALCIGPQGPPPRRARFAREARFPPPDISMLEPVGAAVAKNSDQDMNEMFRRLYDAACQKVTLQSQAGFIVTLADYMYKSGLVADQEINMVAFLTEVMIECEYV